MAILRQMDQCSVIDVPAAMLAFGFANDRAGIHTTRTIMLSELGELLAVCPPSSSLADYRTAVVDENALLKPTGTTRESTFRWLRALYVLDPNVVLFRALRDLWDTDLEARPLLALLLAAAREPLLRATAPAILAAPRETLVESAILANAVNEGFPGRYN